MNKACEMEYTQGSAKLNIMLADDDADDRYFFERALEDIPIATDLRTVPDGEHLMSYLADHADHLPDVLFLDINMPRKNGIECLTEIKHNELLRQIPVVMCSTAIGEDIEEKLYQTGAYYYLHKCNYSELKKYIQQILTLLHDLPDGQPPRNLFRINMEHFH